MRHAIVIAALLAAAPALGAGTLQVTETTQPAACQLTGTNVVGPCAFMAAMLEQIRSRCAAAGLCNAHCAGDFCPVKL